MRDRTEIERLGKAAIKRFFESRGDPVPAPPVAPPRTIDRRRKKHGLVIEKRGQKCAVKRNLLGQSISLIKTVGSRKIDPAVSDKHLQICRNECPHSTIVRDTGTGERRTLCHCCGCGDWRFQLLRVDSAMEYKVTKAGASCPLPEPKWVNDG